MYRVAVLSDVHGNTIALDAVLEAISATGSIDEYWILGDLVAIGHEPIGAIERLRSLPMARFVRGNTDRFVTTGERPWPRAEHCVSEPRLWPICLEIAASFAWTRGMIDASGSLGWLAKLPLELRTELPDGTRVLGVHASPGTDDGRSLHPALSPQELRKIASDSRADLLLVGHTHWPMDIKVDGVRMVNVGSVSNPFPPDLRATYVLIEADGDGYSLYRREVEYDRQAVIEALEQGKHPAPEFIARYMKGANLPGWQRSRGIQSS